MLSAEPFDIFGQKKQETEESKYMHVKVNGFLKTS